MKKLGILGIDDGNLIYGCPVCSVDKENIFERIVPIFEIVVYKSDGNILFGKLPQCSKCGSLSFVIPNNSADTVPAHLRRVVIARAIDNGQLMEGTTEEDATVCRQLLKGFYTEKGNADLDAEFEGTVEVKRFVEGYKQEDVAE